MADARQFLLLEQIRDGIGFPSGVGNTSSASAQLDRLNTTVSLSTTFVGQTASNVSAAAGQLALLNTTASMIAYRLPGLRFAYPAPNEVFSAITANPAAGNTTMVSGPVGAIANILYRIRMQFAASHASPGKDISFRDGTAGASWFTTRVPQGTSSFEIVLPTPMAQTAAQAAVCFVATGFSAVGNYEIMYGQKIPGS